MPDSSPIGIDLGTTFSALAHIDQFGQPLVVPNAEGERVTASVLLFEEGHVIVGTAALQQAIADPEKVVEFVKREIGKSKSEYSRTFNGITYSAEELSSLILRKLKQDAEVKLGFPVTEAVITVPAYFSDPERKATINAGELAGLKVLQVINEPTAAALAYGINRLSKDQTVFVFDLGGGTLDVTLMAVEKGGIRMLATNGDHKLGGKDWDDILVNLVAEEFDKQHGLNPLLDPRSYQELYNRAVAAKIQLSRRSEATIVHAYEGVSVRREISRQEFEERSAPLVERCRSLCEIVMKEAGLGWDKVHQVMLVGGMTRVPLVRAMIKSFGEIPLAEEMNPDEVVAQGAAIQAMLCKLQKESITPEGLVLDPAKARFANREGGLIQVKNITSHSLGVVLWDDTRLESYVFPMISKMTPFPVSVENSFGTSIPNLEKVVVKIVEGESSVPDECTLLGTCTIDLPPLLPKGAPITLRYHYDENQVLEVLASGFGKESKASIVRGTGLQDHEVANAKAELLKIEVS